MTSNKSTLAQLTIDRSGASQQSPLSFSYIAIAGLAIVAFLFYWFNAAAQISASPTPTIATATAIIAPSSDTAKLESPLPANQTAVLDASGHIIARRVATVSSRVTGKLNLLNIEEGQLVTKSQVLAELDDQQAKISYQLALAELASKQASYDELLIVEQHALKNLKRHQQLLTNKLVSEQVVDASQFKAQQIAAQLNNKQAMINLSSKRVELAEYQLVQHKIRAPFDGVVISKNAQVGELISAGSSGGGFIRTGVGTIVDMSSLEIEVEVGESYINRVFAGQQVTATLDAYPQWQINSEVEAIIPTADRQKASIKVRIKLLEIDHRVLPDMGVKVSFFG